MTSGSAALYQVAVALVPALLFGGAILEVREQPRGPRSRKLVGFGMAALLAAGVLAEIVAIRGAIDPAVSDLERRFLVLVLTAGTAGLAIWLAAPLLRDATDGTRVRLGWPYIAVAIALTAVVGQIAITESLDHASARQALDEASKQVERRADELHDALDAESTARTQLLVLVRSLGSPKPVLAVVMTTLGELDDGRLDPVGNGNFNPELSRPRAVIAIRRLNAISLRLEGSFLRGIPGLSAADRELLVQAGRRLISATSQLMVTRENIALADRQTDLACAAAAFLGCRPVRPIH